MKFDDFFDAWMQRPVVGLPLRMVIDERWHRRLTLIAMVGIGTWFYGMTHDMRRLADFGKVLCYPFAIIGGLWFATVILSLLVERFCRCR